jgi:hypothetical protein
VAAPQLLLLLCTPNNPLCISYSGNSCASLRITLLTFHVPLIHFVVFCIVYNYTNSENGAIAGGSSSRRGSKQRTSSFRKQDSTGSSSGNLANSTSSSGRRKSSANSASKSNVLAAAVEGSIEGLLDELCSDYGNYFTDGQTCWESDVALMCGTECHLSLR